MGVVVADDKGCRMYANEAAERLLRSRPLEDLGRLPEDKSLHVTHWPFTSAGQKFTAISFSEAGQVEWELHRVAAFARTASWIACRRPLQDVLDGIALEARNATGATACSVILLDPETFRVRLVGAAGHTEDYPDRLMRSVELGAPLASIDAFRTARPARRSQIRDIAQRDPRYEPLAAPTKAGGWDEVVAVPALLQGQCAGVLTSFYRPGKSPTADDLTFLTALADQTATAVDNANLVTELQSAAAAAERHDLAIDLHDSVSQALFSVVMQSRALEMRVREAGHGSDPAMVRAVSQLEATAEGMQREIRELLQRMYSNGGPPQGPAEDLTSLVEQLARGASPELRLELPDGELPSLDEPVRRELIRVVREAVTNSVRHASASRITIRASSTARGLAVDVVDDGVGFNPSRQAPGHLGLESMSHRIARIGGSLRIESPTPGTAVRIELPLPNHSGSDR